METKGHGFKHRVLIMRCPEYHPELISRIIHAGMDTLGVKPSGRVLLKPNAVIAHSEVFPHAFTRKEFLDGVLSAVRDRSRTVQRLLVGERSGITLPTRFSFKQAGYIEVIRKHGAKACFFDECRQIPVQLTNPQSLHEKIFVKPHFWIRKREYRISNTEYRMTNSGESTILQTR
jgi:uncharacterized protein (DUF362 family)